jgi:hypothetical protein
VKRLVEYELEDGGTILVEVNIADDYAVDELVPAAPPGELVRKAEQTLDEALGSVRRVAAKVVAQVRGLADSPDEVAVEFGVKLTGGVNVVVASGGAESNINVTLTWKGDGRHAG